MSVKIKVNQQGTTLLKFLRENLSDYPSVKALKRAIDAKQCTINGRVEFFSTHPVHLGDEIEIRLAPKKRPLDSKILFEDEEFIIFNKVPHVASESFEGYHLVHRLDKETSGVFLMAKTQVMCEQLQELFAKREMEKEYIALCDGLIEEDHFVVDNHLGKKASYQGGVIFGSVGKSKGKRAVTHFQVIDRGSGVTLVQAKPITGRTHQIRVHLKEEGHPVLGDWQYSRRFSCPKTFPRVMLHAKKLSFTHPISGEQVNVEAPLHDEAFFDCQNISDW